MSEPIAILEGVCGSVAHGLAHEGSDEDVHGVFSYPTSEFWSLNLPNESIVRTNPDYSAHELKKFLLLALKSNPQVLELLWLDSYQLLEENWGERLLDARKDFASEMFVRKAYLGYADAQFRKLSERHETLEVGTRSFKHAKHLFRLLEQGGHLLATGELKVKVEDKDWYMNVLPSMAKEEVAAEFRKRVEEFKSVRSVLPEYPDVARVSGYLFAYRKAH